MPNRTCTADDCERPHQARGLCASHYGTWHRRTHGRNDQTFTKTCIMCGTEWVTRRDAAKYCSVQCKGDAYRTVCKLPDNHPVRLLITEARQVAAEQAAERRRERDRQRSKSQFLWRTARECPGCACIFTPLYTPSTITCSRTCARRVAKRRRRAREHGARGSWTWSEFMAIARKFGYRCAYCGVKPDRLDPDHVVPLSRGGYDSPSNLLPACFMCNSSKCAMTLDEWEAWRAARHMEARKTSWEPGDARYAHLTQALLDISPAA